MAHIVTATNNVLTVLRASLCLQANVFIGNFRVLRFGFPVRSVLFTHAQNTHTHTYSNAFLLAANEYSHLSGYKDCIT